MVLWLAAPIWKQPPFQVGGLKSIGVKYGDSKLFETSIIS